MALGLFDRSFPLFAGSGDSTRFALRPPADSGSHWLASRDLLQGFLDAEIGGYGFSSLYSLGASLDLIGIRRRWAWGVVELVPAANYFRYRQRYQIGAEAKGFALVPDLRLGGEVYADSRRGREGFLALSPRDNPGSNRTLTPIGFVMIPGTLLLALALNAQLSFKDSKVLLANGDTLSGPGEILTADAGWWHSEEYAGLSLAGKTYPAGEIRSARIGEEEFLSLRMDGGRKLSRVVYGGAYAKTVSFSPAEYEYYTFRPGGIGGTMMAGPPMLIRSPRRESKVDYYTVDMEYATAIKYANLMRDLGDCRASRTDLAIHKTLVYSALGSLIAGSGLGITAVILLLNQQKKDSPQHDELITGLGATAAVLGFISIGCTIGLGPKHRDHFLIRSIKRYRK